MSLLTLAGILGGAGAGIQKATDNFSNYGPHGEYVLNGLSSRHISSHIFMRTD